MEVTKIKNFNTEPAFGIKVSSNFTQMAHNHYHYNNVPNKRHLIWKFNNKATEFSEYGHPDYTIDYERKMNNGNWRHYLIATSDDGKNKIILFNRSTLLKIIEKFLNTDKKEFNAVFNSKLKKKG